MGKNDNSINLESIEFYLFNLQHKVCKKCEEV